MKVIAAVLLGVAAAAIMLVGVLIQLVAQLVPLLIAAVVVAGVVAVLCRRQPPHPRVPQGYILVPIPRYPAAPDPLPPPLPAPHRNRVDVQVFGPIGPGDGSAPERWEWR